MKPSHTKKARINPVPMSCTPAIFKRFANTQYETRARTNVLPYEAIIALWGAAAICSRVCPVSSDHFLLNSGPYQTKPTTIAAMPHARIASQFTSVNIADSDIVDSSRKMEQAFYQQDNNKAR